jgi:hypothetical protein
VEKTKKRLLEGRAAEFGAELVRVVDRAVARIERLTTVITESVDALQQVQFEASEERGTPPRREGSSFYRTIGRPIGHVRPGKGIGGARRGKLLQLGPALVVAEPTVHRVQLAKNGNANEAKGRFKAVSTADKKRD